MINDAISLRGCSPPPGMVPLEAKVCPIQQVRLEVLSQENLITPKPKASPATSFQINQINKDFCWQVAQVQALFQTIYKKGLVTNQDKEKVKELSHALKVEKKQLSALGLDAAGLSHAKECLTEANALLKETFALVEAIKKYEHTGKRLDDTASRIVDCTFSPLYSGESLAAVNDVAKALFQLNKLQSLVMDGDPDSAAYSRLAEMFEKDREELASTLEDWGEQLLLDIKQEQSYASDQPNELRLQSALDGKRVDLTHKLKKLSAYCKQNPELKNMGKQLEKFAQNVQKTAPKQQLPPVAPLGWGSAEWVSLRQQRPQVKQSQFRQLVQRLTDSEQWSERTHHLVHAVLVGMQLSQTAVEISSQFNHAEKIKEVEEDVALLAMLLSQGKKTEAVKPAIRAVMELTEGKQLSHEEIHDVLDAYRLHELLQDTPEAKHSLEEVLALFKNETVLPNLSWAPGKISAIGSCLPTDPNYSSLIEQKRSDALVDIEHASEALAECERTVPQLENAEQKKDVHYYVNLLYKELLKSVEKAPPKTCSLTDLALWKQKVEDQCYAVKTLEEQIAKLMEPLRQATKGDDLDRFGNKHKNLILQARLVEALQIPDVIVPVPRGVPTEQIESFLRLQAPDVFTHWEALGELFKAYSGHAFLQEPAVVSLFEKIDQAIEQAFAKAAQDEASFKQLVPQDVITWLHTLLQNGDYVMVRSTGAEDSRQLANAGGNVSRSYVSPERTPFATALGDVVRSYFSYSSLQNRLNAKMNPFAQELKLSVTAQQLIGEPLGGAQNPSDIPISLVLFSSEPLYVGGERFRVMRISASYGHGEGVVGNLGIASDTALLLISEVHPDQLYVLYDNQSKPVRLAPVMTPDGVVLDKVANPPELRDHPALTPELLTRLYHWGVVGEKYFDDYPTDYEIVIKGGKIYSVQARPINRRDMLPTYLDVKKLATLSNSPIKEKLQAEMIVPGGASVVTIHHPNEIHYATTLKEAHDTFIQGQHKLVVVSKPEPANSHPVVNFSSMGMPCLLINNGKDIEALQQKITEQTPLVACMQSATINLWDAAAIDLEQYVSRGFAVHPAKIAVSLNVSTKRPMDIPPEVPQEVKDLVIAVRSAATQEAAQKSLQELRSHEWVTTIKERKLELAKTLKTMRVIPKQVKQTYNVLQALDDKVDRAFAELSEVFKSMQETDRLRPLFHAKALESLLFARPSGNSPGQYSLLDVKPLHAEALAVIDYQKQLSHKAHFATELFVGKQTFDSAFEPQWHSFLLKLEALVEQGVISLQQVRQFKHQIVFLEKTGLLIAAMTFFSPELSQDPVVTFQSFLQLLPKEEEGTIFRMQELTLSLKEMQAQLESFGNKKAFNQVFANLKMNAKALQFSAIKDAHQGASAFTRLLILKNMADLVEVFDIAIKTMKASPQYLPSEKVKLFKEMLHPYMDFLQDWAASSGLIYKFPFQGIEYLDTLQDFFNSNSDNYPELLLPSKNFNVARTGLGPRTYFLFHIPETLEDFFTLIHQDLITLITLENSEINSSERLQNAKIPQEIKTFLKQISGKCKQSLVQISEHEMIVMYNVSLRYHSALLKVAYNKVTEKTTLTAFFYGLDDGDRWNTIAILASMLDALSLLPLVNSVNGERTGVQISWNVTSAEKLKKMLEEFQVYCNMTFYVPILPIVFEEMRKRWSDTLNSEERDLFNDKIMTLSLDWMQHGDEVKSFYGWQIASSLVDQDRGIKAAIAFAQKVLFDSDPKISQKGIDLAIQLIYKGFEIPGAVLLLSQLTFKEDASSRLKGLELASALIEQDKGVEEAVAAMQKSIAANESWERKKAFELAIKLISKGYGISEMVVLIPQLSSKEDSSICKTGLDLAAKLVHQGHGIAEAIAAMQKHITNDDYISNLLDLAYELVNKDQGIAEAVAAMQKGVIDSKSFVREKASFVAIKLVSKGHGITESIPLVPQLLSDEDSSVRRIGWKLAFELIEHGHGIAEAVAAMQKNISANESLERDGALQLSLKLISKGYGISEAIALMLELTSGDSHLQGLALASALVERGEGIETILLVAKKLSSDHDSKVQMEGRKLLQKLMDHGYGIQRIFREPKTP